MRPVTSGSHLMSTLVEPNIEYSSPHILYLEIVKRLAWLDQIYISLFFKISKINVIIISFLHIDPNRMSWET